MPQARDYLLALGAGALLAAMVSSNSLLAKLTTPIVSSWVAHGVGTVISALLLATLARRLTPTPSNTTTSIPLWAYAGGITGALTVMVAAMAVNSVLGLAGTLALGLVGQISFGLVSDHFGWFDMPKRKLTLNDLVSTLAIVGGSLLIILFRA